MEFIIPHILQKTYKWHQEFNPYLPWWYHQHVSRYLHRLSDIWISFCFCTFTRCIGIWLCWKGTSWNPTAFTTHQRETSWTLSTASIAYKNAIHIISDKAGSTRPKYYNIIIYMASWNPRQGCALRLIHVEESECGIILIDNQWLGVDEGKIIETVNLFNYGTDVKWDNHIQWWHIIEINPSPNRYSQNVFIHTHMRVTIFCKVKKHFLT